MCFGEKLYTTIIKVIPQSQTESQQLKQTHTGWTEVISVMDALVHYIGLSESKSILIVLN